MEAALFVLIALVVGLLAATFMWSLRSERQPRRAPIGLLAALTAVDAAGLVVSVVMASWPQAAIFGSQAVLFGAMLVQGLRARRSA